MRHGLRVEDVLADQWDDEVLQLDAEGWAEHYDGSVDRHRRHYSIPSSLAKEFGMVCRSRGHDPNIILSNMMARYVRATRELGPVVCS